MNILIFKLGFLGDVIMSLPALVKLREKHPDAHITWVADKPVVPMLEATTLIDRIVVLPESKLFNGSVVQRATEVLAFWKRLGIGRYDLILSGHADPKVKFLLLPARAREWRMFNRDGTGWQPIFPVPGRHHTHEFIKLFVGTTYPNAVEVVYPTLTLPTIDAQLLPPKPFITLAPGGTQSSIFGNGWLRRWPVEKYVELARQLRADGYEIALIGGKDDAWVLPHFAGIDVHTFMGRFSVLETIRFLSYTRLLITHDCGPLHFAALANAPVLGIFGPTNPAEKVPLHGKAAYVWGGEHLSCRPCYDNKVYAPCQQNECITSVSVERVLSTIRNQFPDFYFKT